MSNVTLINSSSLNGQININVGSVINCSFDRTDGAWLVPGSSNTTSHALRVFGTNIGSASGRVLIDNAIVTKDPTSSQATIIYYLNPGTWNLTDGASIATDASLFAYGGSYDAYTPAGPYLGGSNVFLVTLAGNRTLTNPTNLTPGVTYTWVITQDGTGSRTLAYGTMFTFPGGTKPTLSTAAGAVDVLTAVYDGTALRAQLTKAYS